MADTIISVALPVPLDQLFDYLLPNEQQVKPGCRVVVPFGHRKLVGIAWEIKQQSDFPRNKLKPIASIIDEEPILNTQLKHYCQWLSSYYHYPLGETCFTVLPNLLRKNIAAELKLETQYQLTEAGEQASEDQFKRAPKQYALINLLRNKQNKSLTSEEITQLEISRSAINALLEKSFLKKVSINQNTTAALAQPLQLNPEQATAYEAIQAKLNEFHCFLLEGITGSGKTEVYLQIIAEVIKQNKQALVLVPEISLTPQTIARFTERFGNICIALHSGITDRGRLNAWLQAANGQAKIIIGTRSAVFTPLQSPGVIIIDEEHDLSFKQQEGLRYSARDFALIRARHEKIPIVLGSATPSLESLYNSEQRFSLLKLSNRANEASLPNFQVIDIRKKSLIEGLSETLINKIKQHLNNNQQVLLFLNRRGYSPVLFCHECGWSAKCERCNIHYTLHQAKHRLICHHCNSSIKIPKQCGQCESEQLVPVGVGTERIEQALKDYFPNEKITRIDRDSTRKKNALNELLAEINSGKPQILIGTQMLAKGHHFPNVTLVGILNADNGFFSSDFRAIERLGQLTIQVAGRAGRANQKGEVLIQTHQPHNPLLLDLIKQGYSHFAQQLLTERKLCQLPPYSYFALFRAEANNEHLPSQFLVAVKQLATELNIEKNIEILGPSPAPMMKRAGKYRLQLLLKTSERKPLHQLLQQLTFSISQMKLSRQVRWSLDIDPMEMF